MKSTIVLTLSLIAIHSVVTTAFASDKMEDTPRLYQGFGDYSRTISTQSQEAQKWFNQGIQLLYGFNHDEAIRSFHQAAQVDPTAAMPWWGIAYAHGININDPAMTDERSRAAREAADQALARLSQATPVEIALIKAVSDRYQYPAPDDRKPLDQAYADSMGTAHKAFPNDPDLATLYADALMNLQPWDYWDNEGNPQGRIQEIVNVLEGAIAMYPNHPGANHFYIHAVEASQNPDRAIAAADRLQSLVPGSGHLVHMPSHIYVRVGRYNDAVDSNAQAVSADRTYFAVAPKPFMYSIYYAHNLHFLAYAAMMSGRYDDALEAARNLEREMPEDALRELAGIMDGIMPTTFHVMIRFGKWEEILQEPEYPDYRFVSIAVRRYARSIACSALGKTEQARVEMAAFEKAVAAIPEDWYIFNNRVDQVLPIARAMIEGELLFREGKFERAFSTLRKGIEAEDALVYDEPPGWMLPVRHALGALLMSQGHYAEAETLYREDLKRNRDNGWGLIGLRNALNAQKKNSFETMGISDQLAEVWANADTPPIASCLCEPKAF